MILSEFLDTYADFRNVKQSTLDNYRYVLLRYSKHLKRPAELSDLSDRSVNRWLRSLECTHAPDTVRSTRCTILSVWNLAAKVEPQVEPPNLIRQAPRIDTAIETINGEQIQALIVAANGMTKKYNGYRRSDYYRTLIRAILESSMRIGDLHSLEWNDAQRPFSIVQGKTGRRRRVSFSKKLLDDMKRWHSRSGLCWPAGSPKTSGRAIASLGRSLGFHCTTTILRKTSITNVERQQPGTGWLHAGHASPETTRRWYTDWEQVKAPRPDFFDDTP